MYVWVRVRTYLCSQNKRQFIYDPLYIKGKVSEKLKVYLRFYINQCFIDVGECRQRVVFKTGVKRFDIKILKCCVHKTN